jgi:hypothetical protein
MVLGDRLKEIRYIFATFILIFCAIDLYAADCGVVFLGWNLNIIEKEDACMLIASNGLSDYEMVLAPTPPCEFASYGEPRKTQYKHFNDPNNQTVLIAFGTPYKDELPANWPKKFCGTESQGVLITDNSVRLSKHVARGGLHCSGRGNDEMRFRMFNEPAE